MRQNIKVAGIFLLCSLFLISAVGCNKKKMSVKGKVEGAWQTEWEADVKSENLGKLTVNETLILSSDNSNGSKGSFEQVYQGTVKSKGGSDIPFTMVVPGTWKIKNKNNIVLSYDVNKMFLNVGSGNLTQELKNAGVTFKSGDWFTKVLEDGAKSIGSSSLNDNTLDNTKRELNSYFRDKFHDISKDKGGLSSIVIDGSMMTCKTDQGWFADEQTYDQLDMEKLKSKFISESKPQESNVSSNKISSYPYDWLLSRYVTYDDIASKSLKERRIMRNYIFARHNYRFRSPDLMKHFSQYSWYSPLYDNVTSQLNSIEVANVEFIKSYE